MPRQLFLRAGAFFDKDLHEGAGFRLFPRQGFLASRQLDDHVADAARFATFQHDVLRQIVPLVQQAQRCHPVLNRGAIFAFDHWPGLRRSGSTGLHFRRRGRRFLFAPAQQRASQRERRRDRE